MALLRQPEVPSRPLRRHPVYRLPRVRRRPARPRTASRATGEETELDATTYTVVLDKGDDRYLRRMCMHCADPSCASACPVGAFTKTELGPVVYDGSKCLGCRYCMMVCPFNVPRYEWSNPVPVVRKCDGCFERQKEGEETACTEACPAEATVGGTREELLAEAKRRIAESPGTYHPEIYGEHEVGGTSVLILSPVPFEQLGMKIGPRHRAAAEPHLGRPLEDPQGRRDRVRGPLRHLLDHPPAAGRGGRRARREGVTTMRSNERFRPGLLDLALRADPRRGRRRHRAPLLEGPRRGHQPLRPVPLGAVDRLRRAVRRRPGRRRLHDHDRRLRLQPEALQADRAAHHPHRLPRLHPGRGRAHVRPRQALEHLAPDGHVEPALGDVRGRRGA